MYSCRKAGPTVGLLKLMKIELKPYTFHGATLYPSALISGMVE